MDREDLYAPFAFSIQNTLSAMSEIPFARAGAFYENAGDFNSLGAMVVVSFSGKRKGRFLIDMENKIAVELARRVTGEPLAALKDQAVIAALSEIGNIIAGDAVTAVNNQFGYGLRLTPPVVFAGDGMTVGLQNTESYTMDFEGGCSRLKINVAFERA